MSLRLSPVIHCFSFSLSPTLVFIHILCGRVRQGVHALTEKSTNKLSCCTLLRRKAQICNNIENKLKNLRLIILGSNFFWFWGLETAPPPGRSDIGDRKIKQLFHRWYYFIRFKVAEVWSCLPGMFESQYYQYWQAAKYNIFISTNVSFQ